MKKYLSLIALLVFPFTFLSAESPRTKFTFLTAESPRTIRLMNVQNLLSAYGFKNGVFQKGHSSINKIDFFEAENYASLEGDKNIIDTPAEFLTAVYYSPIKITPAAQAIVNKELPQGQEGALRLCDMWLRKKAEGNMSCSSCDNAVRLIMTKAELNKDQVIAHFKESIEKEVIKYGEQHLKKYYASNGQLRKDLMPVIKYYIKPTQDNILEIAKAVKKSKNYGAYLNTLDSINPAIASRVRATLANTYAVNFR